MKNIVVIISMALFTLFLGFFRPFYDWDVIGYAAAAYQKDGYEGKNLINVTYEAIKSHVNEKKYKQLTVGEFKEAAYSDPVFFKKILSLYSAKTGYIFLVRAIKSIFNCDYVKAIIIISSLFAALSTLVLGFVLVKENVNVLFLPVIVLTIGYLDLASLATSDAVALFLLLVGTYYFQKNNLSILLFLLIPFFRPDYIVFVILFSCFLFFKGSKVISFLSLAGSIIVFYLNLMNSNSADYRWATSYFYSENLGLPVQAETTFVVNWVYIIRVWVDKLYYTLSNGRFTLFFLAIGVLFMKNGFKKLNDQDYLYLIIPSAYAVFHLICFLNYEHRYFTFPETFIFIWLLKEFKKINTHEIKPQNAL